MNEVESSSLPVCCKCKERTAQVENRKEKICNECFLQQCLHRFKSTVRTKLKIWNDEKFLVCVSGGANSMAMLDMLHYSMDSNTHRKMFYKVLVLYIDQGLIYGHSKEQRLSTQNRLTQFISLKSSFDLCILPLESVLNSYSALKLLNAQIDSKAPKQPPHGEQLQKNQSLGEAGCTSQTESSLAPKEDLEAQSASASALMDEILNESDEVLSFVKFLESFPTRGSSRQDVVHLLKRKLMQWVARIVGIKKILLGNSGFSVASGIFGALCKGRGAHLPLEVGFSDQLRGEDVLTCLPLKDLLLKEITYYNYLRQVPVEQQVTLAQLQNKMKLLPSHGSINELCENFLNELQDHSFMTVPTVLRTGARLALKSQPQKLCTLCRGLIDEAKNALETLSVGVQPVPLEDAKEESKEEAGGEKPSEEGEKKLSPLCFGCAKLMKESSLPESEVRLRLSHIWEKFNY